MLKQQTQQLRIRLYTRLSKDDGDVDKESNSIITQLELGRRWCKENNSIIIEEYIDDGYSGTMFERPAFKRMMNDIESDKLPSGILVKDMSRFGRNNAIVMYYVEEILPKQNVTFIALNDNVDTRSDDGNELMPFKSIINEYYARDLSKKIRSAKRNQALQGRFIGSTAPYGYKRSATDKYVLEIDEDANRVVKKIFSLAYRGKSNHWIARYLYRANILSPGPYREYKKGIPLNESKRHYRNPPTYWMPKAVRRILMNQVYLGHTVAHKRQSKSFKNRTLVDNPKEKWIIIENTHPRTVDDEVFKLIQKFLSVKKRTRKKGKPGLFTGLVKCPDCEKNLVLSRSRAAGKSYAKLRCSSYSKNARLCTSHIIRYDDIYQIVLDSIKERLSKMNALGNNFTDKIEALSAENSKSSLKTLDKELAKNKNRLKEIDTMIMRLFEQNALGKMSDERQEQMTIAYENEQIEIKSKITELHAEIADSEKHLENTQYHIDIISKYKDVSSLTREMICELIDFIYVYDAVGKGEERKQDVKITYRFLNNVSL